MWRKVLEHLLNFLHHGAVDRTFVGKGRDVSLHIFHLVFKNYERPGKTAADRSSGSGSGSGKDRDAALMEDHLMCIPYIPAHPDLDQVIRQPYSTS